jgi:transposase
VAPASPTEIDGHYYSVPFGLLRETVDARFTHSTIEVFHDGKRIASHLRSRVAHKHTTIAEHMPSSHRRYAEWSPARMLREAEKIGPATIALFEAIMKAKPHPEQGFRSCLGILNLVKSYGPERAEAAAKRGNDIGATTYGSIKSILQNGLDRAFAKSNTPDASPIRHANIRGRGYYH